LNKIQNAGEMMATIEEAAEIESNLLKELGREPSEFTFHIPGWTAQSSSVGLHWMKSMLYEGFYVAHNVEKTGKRVFFKYWEYGDSEPSWKDIKYDA